MEDEPAYFELEDVSFAYAGAEGRRAVSGVSLKIGRGELVGLIGPNGAGKSTLLSLALGLRPPLSGRALIDGEDAARLDPAMRARKVAYVPQSSRVVFPYTVREIVEMGRRPWTGPLAGLGPADRDRVDWAMDVVGVAELAGRRFNELSGGETQRAILARALAQDAPGLVLDEPTASLDLKRQVAFYELLERLHRAHDLTALVVTHEINLAAEYCPRLVGMREGRIVVDGPPEKAMTAETLQDLYDVRVEVIVAGGARFARARGER